MLCETFTLDIRPTFVDELNRTVVYIERELKNPEAADRLVEDVYATLLPFRGNAGLQFIIK